MGKLTQLHKPSRKVMIREDGSVRVVSENGLDTRTDQSFKDQQNVNSIMRRYASIGYNYANMPEVAKGVFGDFTKAKDYQSALNASIEVQKAFMQLPADIRKRFYNDPQKLNDFMKDPKNIKEAQELGLVKKTPPPEDKIIPKTETLK